MSFSDFGVAVTSPVSTNPEYACGQNVIKANVIAANGDGSDVSYGWVGPVKEVKVSVCLPISVVRSCSPRVDLAVSSSAEKILDGGSRAGKVLKVNISDSRCN